jgi:L-ascorbate metabolism protein UlaG (beta-lactamase superfamily)
MSAVTYVGHATLLVELGGVRVLTDPVLRRGIAHIWRRSPLPEIESLLPIDAIVVSHAHHDHLDMPTLRRLTPHCRLVVGPRGSGSMLRRAGAREVTEVHEGDRVAVRDVVVEAVPALHDGRRYPLAPAIPALGFLLHGPARVYFAGDTDLFDGMSELAGRVDVATLPIAGWGPRLPPGHLNPEGAAKAVALIRPRIAVPIHWGTFSRIDLLRKDALAPTRAFAEAVARLAPGVDVRVLAPGERLDLDP